MPELVHFHRVLFLLGGAAFVCGLLVSHYSAQIGHTHRIPRVPGWCGLLAAAAILGIFVVWAGNQQFGGYDYSVSIDSGWRLWSGQTPYSDFICTLPPGFLLGAALAFRAFGPSWDAQLYLTALFAASTFLWLYYLLARLLASRVMAFLTALCLSSATVLVLSFWHHSMLASLAGDLFLLSAVLYVFRPRDAATQVSYAAAVTLLALMKPNVSVPLLFGAVVILLVFAPSRLRLLLLSGIGLAAGGVALALGHISLSGIYQSYVAAASSRGNPLQLYGISALRPLDRLIFMLCLMGLALPVPVFVRWLVRSLRRWDREAIAVGLLLGLGGCTSLLAMATNMELKYVDMGLLICVGAVSLWGRPEVARNLQGVRFNQRAVFGSFLAALTAITLYCGAARYRVEGIGLHAFFEWTDGAHTVEAPFFRGLHTSSRFVTVMRQTGEVLSAGPSRAVYFGPRMEFGYAAFHLPSPTGLPIWWHQGSAFAMKDWPAILQRWRRHQFDTLIFLKNDFTQCPPDFLALLPALYTRDDHYSELTVFHRRNPVGLARSAPPPLAAPPAN